MKKFPPLLCCVVLLMSCAERRSFDLVPYPENLTPIRGVYAFAGATMVGDARLDEASRVVVEAFAVGLAEAWRCTPITYTDAPGTGDGFVFTVDSTLGPEAYRLGITRRGVAVQAAAMPGFQYAVQTLRQLLPAGVYGVGPVDGSEWTLPCVRIGDSPRFAYRGLHLDVARHFFPVEEVKKILDVMVVHKLNTFHWHLTDDQGWRIEIKRYPELTSYGSIRKKTMIRKEWNNYAEMPCGAFYTQDQIRDVVDYAAARGITVIPEIDLPGHMMAALACYPDLGCTGGPYEVSGQWGVRDDVLCPGKEQTFTFVEGVLAEVLELFPSQYIHIGGDECPKIRWEKCPACQTRIHQLGLKADAGHSAEHYLQNYVTARVERYLKAHGRRIIGWDEILEGELAPDATVMSWRGSEGGIAAVKLGHDAIMTPTSHFYFDYYQSADVEHEPFGIGGFVPIEKVYAYEPIPDSLAHLLGARILGVQANLWTEYIATPEHLEYMLLPRLAALSEVQWCRSGHRDWERFSGSLSHLVSIYEAMGLNYSTVAFGAQGEIRPDSAKRQVEVTLTAQGGAPVRYTLDGTEPTAESALYTEPVAIADACTLRALAMREDGLKTRPWSCVFTGGKAVGRRARANTAPEPRYAGTGVQLLTDGVPGRGGFGDGTWMGWYDQPLDVTVDLEDAEIYDRVTLVCRVEPDSWIFPPVRVSVSASDDHVNFAPAGALEIPVPDASAPGGRMDYSVTFPPTRARYLRVVAEPLRALPSWHDGAGQNAYLFAAEISVQ